jgi:hypothetical protein
MSISTSLGGMVFAGMVLVRLGCESPECLQYGC